MKLYVGGRAGLEDEQAALAEEVGMIPCLGWSLRPACGAAGHRKGEGGFESRNPVSLIVIYAVNPFCAESKADCYGYLDGQVGVKIQDPIEFGEIVAPQVQTQVRRSIIRPSGKIDCWIPGNGDGDVIVWSRQRVG